ncbi:hypothetical protein A2524_01565 [Candidatus Wolfebacteria bacterium RIFOXYD12_FULL_48_21]|uniref:DUF2007 domain-containing protein n=1 Tax=Candidatus Wolfebacteria bacterium RIFOXYD1_FULL_48_65 TaxID=1802561 RepID=A0A1F8E1Y1_9BACT|nr:MAG: hypothetical protein A2610_03540 [Candidatus Wolfebacteria bacterium RIFOXYD1_FULL_48_65]OGM94490.1 MAG: hypothetical protein A2524_01565 [Candidatus Wolfebacteria bacterium RIFOXYD12_FULL_48_21]OGM96676.1 MAG: hypothetical protein A2532_03915 [Candidatus Wolfebacteria bacterium RIFOXYD2_FULL_48_11]
MAFSFFRVKYVPIYTVFDVNSAWIAQDTLLTNGIKANIEVEPCKHAELCSGGESYSVCVPGNDAEKAKEFVCKKMQ